MKITLTVLGVEVGNVDIDLSDFQTEPDRDTVVEKATKATSRWWVKRMVK